MNEFEQALKAIQESIETIKTGKDDNAKAIADLMLKFAEIQATVTKFNTERRLGLDDRHPFKSHELEEATKFRDFFNAAMKKDFAVLKTLNSEIDSDGGILVPEEFRPRILRIIEIYGMARKLGTIIPMKSDKITMPTLASGVTVYWGSGSSNHATLGGQAWSGLGANGIPVSQPSFGDTSLTIDEMYCLVPIANQLIDDAVLDIVNLIITLIGEAIAKEEDRMGFMGSETAGDPFTGAMMAATNVLPVTGSSFSAVTADDLADMIDCVDGDISNASYIMHATVFNIVRKMKDKNDNYIWQPPTSEGPGTIWGYPYTRIRSLPRVGHSATTLPFVGFGDWRNLYIPDRQQLRIASSEAPGFVKNQTYIRAHERVGFKLAIPSTISVLLLTNGSSTTE